MYWDQSFLANAFEIQFSFQLEFQLSVSTPGRTRYETTFSHPIATQAQ